MKILHHCCREWTEEFSCYSQGQDLLRDKWCVLQLPGTPWTLTTTWYNAPLSQRVQSASRLPQILRESKVCRIANCPSKLKLAWSLSLKKPPDSFKTCSDFVVTIFCMCWFQNSSGFFMAFNRMIQLIQYFRSAMNKSCTWRSIKNCKYHWS